MIAHFSLVVFCRILHYFPAKEKSRQMIPATFHKNILCFLN